MCPFCVRALLTSGTTMPALGAEAMSRRQRRVSKDGLVRHLADPRLAEDMSDARDRARDALKALVAEAHAQVVTSAEPLAEYTRGTAVFNLERDRPLADLPGFPVALATLQQVPEFVRAFGTEHGERATLQFVYEYFTRTERLEFDDDAFDATCEAFISELDDPNWTFVAFANLRNLQSADALIDFGDGISIRYRSFAEIEERLGWTEWHFDHLTRDWTEGHAPSEHVLWVESVAEKSPETAILSDSATGPGRALTQPQAVQLRCPPLTSAMTSGRTGRRSTLRVSPATTGCRRL